LLPASNPLPAAATTLLLLLLLLLMLPLLLLLLAKPYLLAAPVPMVAAGNVSKLSTTRLSPVGRPSERATTAPPSDSRTTTYVPGGKPNAAATAARTDAGDEPRNQRTVCAAALDPDSLTCKIYVSSGATHPALYAAA
jgi:hypothetical protein